MMMFLARFRYVCLAVMLLGLVALAEPASQPKDKPRTDLYGDPLPEGALMRLGTVQLRAAGATLAWSADGKTLIGVRRGKYLSFWDVDSGQLKQTRELPTVSDLGSILSPDGKKLVNRQYDLTFPKPFHQPPTKFEIWDIETGKLLHTLAVKDAAWWNPVVLSRDGAYLAAVEMKFGPDFAKIVHVWSMATGKVVFTKSLTWKDRGEDDWVGFTPNGKNVIVSFSEGMDCWDIATGEELWQTKETCYGPFAADPVQPPISPGFTTPPNDASRRPGSFPAISTDGSKLLTSKIALDLASGKPSLIEKLPDHSGIITGSQVISPDGRSYPYATSQPSQTIVLPDGRTLLFATSQGVHLWDLITGKETRKITGASGVMLLAPDGKTLITNNGDLQRWDLSTGKPLYADNFGKGHNQEVCAVVFSADGKRLVSGSEDGTVRLWDAITGKALQVERTQVYWKPTSFFSSSGPFALATSSSLFAGIRGRSSNDPGNGKGFGKVTIGDKTVQIEDAENCSHITCCVLSPDGSLVAGCFFDPPQAGMQPFGYRIWETATGKSIVYYKNKKWGPPGQLVFHPGNRWLAVSDSEGFHYLDLITGTVSATRKMPDQVFPHTVFASASCLGFTRDGGKLATGHPDGTILLWDADLPPTKHIRLSAKEIETLWADLNDPDATKAWQAIWRLADSPEEAVPFLRKAVKLLFPPAAVVTDPLLADLDSNVFTKREAAYRQLKDLGILAEPVLRQRLKAGPSEEVRQRIELLLKAIGENPEALREVRAVAVLARIQVPAARQFLEELAKGVETTPLTAAAKAALGP